MPKYAVSFHGKNYWLQFEEKEEPKLAGFYTSRGVKAPTVEAAVEKALGVVRRTKRLNAMIHNAADDTPMLYVEEVAELAEKADLKEYDRGFVFYVEEDETG